MATKLESGQYSFQINVGDVSYACIKLLSLGYNNASPLVNILTSYEPGQHPPTGGEALNALIGKPAVTKALSILATPELCLHISAGGGMVSQRSLSVCRNRSIDPAMVITLTPSAENTIQVQTFETVSAFVTWIANTITSSITVTPERLLPESMRFESLIYALQAIDSFRRVAYESMLLATPSIEPHISLDEFVSSMKLTLRNEDIRWLLPSFAKLIPDISSLDFDSANDHLEFLVANDILVPGRKLSANTPVFSFGEKGSTLAIDFFRTWWTSVGLSLNAWDGNSLRTLSRAFIAATANANHYFDIGVGVNGALVASYSPLVTAAVELKLVKLLDTLVPIRDVTINSVPPAAPGVTAHPPAQMTLWHYIVAGQTIGPEAESLLRGRLARAELPSTTLVWNPSLPEWRTAAAAGLVAIPAPPPLSPPPLPTGPPPTGQTCSRCQHKIESGVRFCTECGAPVGEMAPAPELAKRCPRCSTLIEPGVRFCTGCGMPQN